jgi:four helix bundle protein
MGTWDLRERTQNFAVAVFMFCRTLPATDEARDIARQLRRSSSSVAANCRALRRSTSDKMFVARAAIVVEEVDEAGFWLDFLVLTGIATGGSVQTLVKESDEIVAIFAASRKTVQLRMTRKRDRPQTSGPPGRSEL